MGRIVSHVPQHAHRQDEHTADGTRSPRLISFNNPMWRPAMLQARRVAQIPSTLQAIIDTETLRTSLMDREHQHFGPRILQGHSACSRFI